MKISDFFEEYGEADGVEVFRFEDLPTGLPDRPGLYAWYAHLSLAQVAAADSASVDAVKSLLGEQVFRPFQRQPYQVELMAALEPAFRGRLENGRPPVSVPEHASDRQEVLLSLAKFLRGPFAPLFSAPIYVGKAERQSLRVRISQHVKLIQRMVAKPRPVLEQHRERLTQAMHEDEDDSEGHSFALEVAARQFPVEGLVLVTWAQSQSGDPAHLHTMELVLNRILFPLCGRR